MTPEEAQDVLHYAGADGELCLTAELAAHAPVMAEQIANMHYEYAVRTSRDGKDDYVYTSSWYRSYDKAADRAAEVKRVNPHTTIIRRLVGDVEVVE